MLTSRFKVRILFVEPDLFAASSLGLRVDGGTACTAQIGQYLLRTPLSEGGTRCAGSHRTSPRRRAGSAFSTLSRGPQVWLTAARPKMAIFTKAPRPGVPRHCWAASKEARPVPLPLDPKNALKLPQKRLKRAGARSPKDPLDFCRACDICPQIATSFPNPC